MNGGGDSRATDEEWAGRTGRLVATGALAVALAGFATGLHQASRPTVAPARATIAHPTTAREAVPYHALQERGPNAGWRGPRSPEEFPCSQCHEAATASDRERRALELEHQELRLVHGGGWCFDCHDAQDRDALHLADGSPVALDDPTPLCAQCHGTAQRDYLHGSHGGMTGAWDAARGERRRVHCLDCHDAHDPAFPGVVPVFVPRDRFLGGSER